jgi:HSP20 family molecular chaperone IbpA
METATIGKCEAQANSPERTRGGRAYRPNVDIVENGDKLMLIADLPGARAEDIDVQYENGVLTLHARVKPRQPAHCTNAVLCEYGVGDYVRTFQVGEGVDAGGISAEVANGVLTLHLPKAAGAKMRKIDVKGA